MLTGDNDKQDTYHLVIGRVGLLGESLVHAVVLDLVDAQDMRLLERPRRDIARELLVARLDAPARATSYI